MSAELRSCPAPGQGEQGCGTLGGTGPSGGRGRWGCRTPEQPAGDDEDQPGLVGPQLPAAATFLLSWASVPQWEVTPTTQGWCRVGTV